MIKRTDITTIEVLTKPVCGSQRTHLLTEYVHKAYPPIYAELARHAGYDSAAIVRGVEGGIFPSLRQESRFYRYAENNQDEFVSIEPTHLGIKTPRRTVPLPDGMKSLADSPSEVKLEAAKTAANLGIEALRNAPGAVRDSLMYSAAITLLHLGRFESLSEAAQFSSKVIASGDSYDKFLAHH